MVNLLLEERLTLNDAAKLTGVVPSTVWRWSTVGVRGKLLDSVLIGGRRFTSREAIDRFIAAVTHAATNTSGQPLQSDSQRLARGSQLTFTEDA